MMREIAIVALLALLAYILYFFRKAAKRRRELSSYSVGAPEGGDGISRFVCVRLTDGSSGSYFKPPAEQSHAPHTSSPRTSTPHP